MEVKEYNGKMFNPEVFEKYLRTLPSTQKNALINGALFKKVNKYRSKMSEQAGGFFVVEPIKGRIGGEPDNYDGNTDIKDSTRKTFYQTKVCHGRAKGWTENDWTTEITGENFEAEASEVKEYWDIQNQKTALSILKGIFASTNAGGKKFAEKHTYKVNGNLGADDCNRASQKALGDMRADLTTMITPSAVATNLEGLNLIDFMKYTDKNGITKSLRIGTYNGRLLIEDDDMPTIEVYEKTKDTEVDPNKTYYTKSGSYTVVKEPSKEALNTYYEKHFEYTTYLFKAGYFEYEDLGVKVPSEIERKASEKGGITKLISRERIAMIPDYISYLDQTKQSPLNSDYEKGANWDLAQSADKTEYVDDKLIPLVRIVSRG